MIILCISFFFLPLILLIASIVCLIIIINKLFFSINKSIIQSAKSDALDKIIESRIAAHKLLFSKKKLRENLLIKIYACKFKPVFGRDDLIVGLEKDNRINSDFLSEIGNCKFYKIEWDELIKNDLFWNGIIYKVEIIDANLARSISKYSTEPKIDIESEQMAFLSIINAISEASKKGFTCCDINFALRLMGFGDSIKKRFESLGYLFRNDLIPGLTKVHLFISWL